MTLAERAECLLLGVPPKGPVQPAWLDSVLELLRDIAARFIAPGDEGMNGDQEEYDDLIRAPLKAEIERLSKSLDQFMRWREGRLKQIAGLESGIERLRRDCAELYQVIGTMAEHCPDPSAPAIVKALDNASDAANGDPRRHDDLLPFVLPPHHQQSTPPEKP